MKNIYAQLLHFLKERKKIALTTIIGTKGSTPQVPGSSALFSPQGLVGGTVGGGLLEAETEKKALYLIPKKKSRLWEFHLEGDISTEEGALCGGTVNILIDASPEEHREAFLKLNQSLLQRNPGVLATSINKISEENLSILREWIEMKEEFEAVLKTPLSSFQEKIKIVFSEEKPALLKINKKKEPSKSKESFLFLEPVFPLSQLVIAGAGHVGQAVAHLGSFLNFEVTVIDDRAEFATKERFPEADHIMVEEIGKAIKNFPISSETYLVIVTRAHRHDAEALRQCITSQAAYIGMIGSGRKINLMRQKFLQERWATPQQFDRVHAPIGLEIYSKTVEEIAVSIAAQLVLVRNRIKEKTKKGE